MRRNEEGTNRENLGELMVATFGFAPIPPLDSEVLRPGRTWQLSRYHACRDSLCYHHHAMSLISVPDEVLSLIFSHCPDPTALTLANRRLHLFSQDPYVRAHYFLSRYGTIQALYFAFCRGKLLTPRVIDVCSFHPWRATGSFA